MLSPSAPQASASGSSPESNSVGTAAPVLVQATPGIPPLDATTPTAPVRSELAEGTAPKRAELAEHIAPGWSVLEVLECGHGGGGRPGFGIGIEP